MSSSPLVVSVLLGIASAMAGCGAWLLLARRYPDLRVETVLSRAPWLYALLPLLGVLVLCEVLFGSRPDLTWDLPLWLEYHLTSLLMWGIVMLVSFPLGLSLCGALHTGHRERFTLILAGILLILALLTVQWQLTRPAAPGLRSLSADGGIILQSSDVSCAAASGANLLAAYGRPMSERQMAEVFGTTTAGTSSAQIILGMRRLGVSCERFLSPGADPAQLRPPEMIFVDHILAGRESHAVLYVGREGELHVLHDPLIGKKLLDRHSLQAIWHGRSVRCIPPSQSPTRAGRLPW